MTYTFTSQQAVDLFKEFTGFEFHPTVPGQLLARCDVQKIGSSSKPSRFDAKHWNLVWQEMFYLALRRCRFDPKLQPPRKSCPPDLDHIIFGKTKQHELKATAGRRYVEIPFSDNDEAKALGAKWDASFRKWYVPARINRNLFRWPDVPLPLDAPEILAGFAESTKPKKKKRKPAARPGGFSIRRLDKELQKRLDHLLAKPD